MQALSVSGKAASLGVLFCDGQEGDQLHKTDRAFCHLDVRRMFAAAGFFSSLRLEGFLKRQIHAYTQ
jgi:hypothetical protein